MTGAIRLYAHYVIHGRGVSDLCVLFHRHIRACLPTYGRSMEDHRPLGVSRVVEKSHDIPIGCVLVGAGRWLPAPEYADTVGPMENRKHGCECHRRKRDEIRWL